MDTTAKLNSKSVDELWTLYETIAEILTAKLSAEKHELELRLTRLGGSPNQVKARRPYPPVFPKFANPDSPQEVWSGRGKQPRWVKEKLSSGYALGDLSIEPVRHHMLMR